MDYVLGTMYYIGCIKGNVMVGLNIGQAVRHMTGSACLVTEMHIR